MPIMTQRAIMLVKVETTEGTDAAPVVGTDAIQVIDPIPSLDPQVLERRFMRRDFSTYASIIGRKLGMMKFSIECTPRGVADTAPRWTRLLEACGMLKATSASGAAKTIAAAPTGAVRASGVTTFTFSAPHSLTPGMTIIVSGVTDATFNGTFQVVTAPTSTTVTVNNPGTNGTSGSGSAVMMAGEVFTPVTDNQKTVTLYLYFEGMLHKLTGARGTFSLQADAGQYATLEFTFTGNYFDPTSVAFPSGDAYDNVNPKVLEYAGLTFDGANTLVANSFKFDIGNEIRPRMDMNAANGYRGVRIISRNPTGGIDPEAEATQTFWSRFSGSTLATLQLRIGADSSSNAIQGQTLQINAPQVQVTGIGYGDRDGLRTYDLALAFRRGAVGDDEITFLFD